ncbi:MAG: acyltransferase [Bacteroidota bacterium]|jgi:acetyltransferase-like isoleucine patch superfamily enzyme
MILKFIRFLLRFRQRKIKKKFNRVLPLGDCIIDRWEKASFLGFGKGSTVYDNVLIIGDVVVGENTWIGPNVILDGSGGLKIGSNCSISAGVQIYSHDTVKWAVSGGKEDYEYAKTTVEDNCYIAPNVIIAKGVKVGKSAIIGANSFVNKDVPPNTKAAGNPIRIINHAGDN